MAYPDLPNCHSHEANFSRNTYYPESPHPRSCYSLKEIQSAGEGEAGTVFDKLKDAIVNFLRPDQPTGITPSTDDDYVYLYRTQDPKPVNQGSWELIHPYYDVATGEKCPTGITIWRSADGLAGDIHLIMIDPIVDLSVKKAMVKSLQAEGQELDRRAWLEFTRRLVAPIPISQLTGTGLSVLNGDVVLTNEQISTRRNLTGQNFPIDGGWFIDDQRCSRLKFSDSGFLFEEVMMSVRNEGGGRRSRLSGSFNEVDQYLIIGLNAVSGSVSELQRRLRDMANRHELNPKSSQEVVKYYLRCGKIELPNR